MTNGGQISVGNSTIPGAASRGRVAGFSLIEVVVAVGIFAVGMVAVIGLFTPVARSVASSADAEIAARVADALRLKLQTMPFSDVAKLLKNSTATSHELAVLDGRIDYSLASDPQLLFASHDGSKIGLSSDPVWRVPPAGRSPDRDKYFEIALIRNEAVSPKPGTTIDANGNTVTVDPDANAALLAYTARLRWPAFIPDPASPLLAIQVGANPNATVRFDHSRKQVLYFAGSVTR
jgi:prepilin-type N-terminal cleavage/methylation domain-containing protein